MADYAVLGVGAIPLPVPTHRLALLAAIGVVAAAGSRRSADGSAHRRLAALGGVGWCLVLAWPLVGLG